ncbi:DUF2520 domain-containing protein [Saccharopolyspora sp. HNM0983]|uniref:DUF2520 domain-containing protein n=1 Tax=Saccharopolyspora montiporae TaxID=2781240 RepID=A0A929FZV2_9PSEU|nr:DUF2520 domain-containing protein [Saccharopolyspora sp. HNM0983]MBE9374137.1 DUF2520 domain-containing protein [Saccharopolyspora sp. HNM0983]
MPAGRTGPRLRIGIISAGRVGAVLGAALTRAQHRVVAVSAVSESSQERAERMLPGTAVLPPDQVAEQADLVLLAVPDDALAGLVRGLTATGSLRAGQIVVHTSGAHGVDVLEAAASAGVLMLAMHPAMTFTGRDEDVQRLADACMTVTATPGDDAGWSVGEALALELGMEPVRVDEEARPLYHAALTHGANHVITLVNESSEMLRAAGVDVPDRVLAPLLSASLDNSLRLGDRAITGPVVRGDAGTVRAHLAAIAASGPAALAGYRELARRTAERAERSGLLGPDGAAEVRAALDEETA